MGSCCATKSRTHPVVHQNKTNIKTEKSQLPKTQKNELPKAIVTAQDAALVYIDTLWTETSLQWKNSLKHKFPNLVSWDGEKRIIKQIERAKQPKHYIIIAGKVRDETLKFMLMNSKVKAIYFCLEKSDLDRYSKSSKIKGFFKNQMDLKQTVFHNMRDDEY